MKADNDEGYARQFHLRERGTASGPATRLRGVAWEKYMGWPYSVRGAAKSGPIKTSTILLGKAKRY